MKRLKTHLHHSVLRRDVINSFEFNADTLAASVRRYRQARPRVVVGYANAVYEFARYAKQAGFELPPPIGVITSAEMLYPYQRQLIEEVFGAAVFNRYGCREVMMIGAECERHCGLHVTSDNLFVDGVQRDGRECKPGETGEVIITDLHNFAMPLIRYKVGNIGAWSESACPCGRGLPLMDVVNGQVLDLIVTQGDKQFPVNSSPT